MANLFRSTPNLRYNLLRTVESFTQKDFSAGVVDVEIKCANLWRWFIGSYLFIFIQDVAELSDPIHNEISSLY